MSIQSERDTPAGWEFDVRVGAGEDRRSLHTLRVAWVDYELWAGGRLRPSDVAEAAFRYALEHADAADERLRDFDASMLRRWFPGADDVIARRLAQGVETD